MRTLKITFIGTTGNENEIIKEIEESKFNAFKELYTNKILDNYYKKLEVSYDWRFKCEAFTPEYRKNNENELKIAELAKTIKFELI